jgi:hypothetical protein
MKSREVLTSHPAIAHLKLPGKTIEVCASTSLTLDETWDGGSRRIYSFYILETGLPFPVKRSPWPQPPINYSLKPGEVVHIDRMFRGKALHPMLGMHPDDFARLMTTCIEHDECRQNAEMARLCFADSQKRDERQALILATIRSYKSGPYRQAALKRLDVTSAEVDALCERQYLTRNRAGSIALTTSGRLLASTCPAHAY